MYTCSQYLRLFPNLNTNHEIWKYVSGFHIFYYINQSAKKSTSKSWHRNICYSFWQRVTAPINAATAFPLTTAEWDIRQVLGSGDSTRNHIILEITIDTWKSNTDMRHDKQPSDFLPPNFLQCLHSNKTDDPNTATKPHNKCWIWL